MVEREARGVLDDVDVAAEVARDDVRRVDSSVPFCELKSTRSNSSKAAARCGRVVCARSARPPPQLSWRTGTTALTQWRCICDEEEAEL